MDWALYVISALIDAVLVLWIFILRRDIREIRHTMDTERPGGVLTREDLQALQHSLSTLVESLESYTEESLSQMRKEVGKMQQLLQGAGQVPGAVTAAASVVPKPGRTIPIRPDPSLVEHREKERIIDLHRRGKSVQEISRELQVSAGEVELVIRMTT